jgi:hypothetical protein
MLRETKSFAVMRRWQAALRTLKRQLAACRPWCFEAFWMRGRWGAGLGVGQLASAHAHATEVKRRETLRRDEQWVIG